MEIPCINKVILSYLILHDVRRLFFSLPRGGYVRTSASGTKSRVFLHPFLGTQFDDCFSLQ